MNLIAPLNNADAPEESVPAPIINPNLLAEKESKFLLYLVSLNTPFNRFEIYEAFKDSEPDWLVLDQMIVRFHFLRWIVPAKMFLDPVEEREEFDYQLTEEGKAVASNYKQIENLFSSFPHEPAGSGSF